MSAASRLQYWRRLVSAYVLPGQSQLTFWHERPEAEPEFDPDAIGPYYMSFARKADYEGRFDGDGIPLLDYRGKIGPQYNPIAIAQYGLGNYNLFKQTDDGRRRERFLTAASWLVENLEPHPAGTGVWMHHFDFEYRDKLLAPWHSGLAQGQGISVLTRAFAETGEQRFSDAAGVAFRAFGADFPDGGVVHVDAGGDPWIEEYPASPPTHILNGFIWGLWGVRDHALDTGSPEASALWERCVETLAGNLHRYDTNSWSLYDLSAPGRLRMVASGFYHRLHIVQLRIMARLTDQPIFGEYADRWDGFSRRRWNRLYNRGYKAVFKVLRY